MRSNDHLTLRRFAGFTPVNVVDRASDHVASYRRRGWKAPARFCSYWGPQRDLELFVALSSFRGRPYRAGDAGRRGRR